MDSEVKRYLLNTLSVVMMGVMSYVLWKVITKGTQQWRKFLGHSDWEQW